MYGKRTAPGARGWSEEPGKGEHKEFVCVSRICISAVPAHVCTTVEGTNLYGSATFASEPVMGDQNPLTSANRPISPYCVACHSRRLRATNTQGHYDIIRGTPYVFLSSEISPDELQPPPHKQLRTAARHLLTSHRGTRSSTADLVRPPCFAVSTCQLT